MKCSLHQSAYGPIFTIPQYPQNALIGSSVGDGGSSSHHVLVLQPPLPALWERLFDLVLICHKQECGTGDPASGREGGSSLRIAAGV